nr:MAG TPA: hypothetical protein [Caudoviricetes sp.]
MIEYIYQSLRIGVLRVTSTCLWCKLLFFLA